MSLSKDVTDVFSERLITLCADYNQLLAPITFYKLDRASVVFGEDAVIHCPQVPKEGLWDLRGSFEEFRRIPYK